MNNEVVQKILKQCREEGILTEFLDKHGEEAVNMLFLEMTEEEARELSKEDGFSEGFDEGIQEGMKEGGAFNRAENETKRASILRLSQNVQAFQSKKSKPYNIECKVKAAPQAIIAAEKGQLFFTRKRRFSNAWDDSKNIITLLF